MRRRQEREAGGSKKLHAVLCGGLGGSTAKNGLCGGSGLGSWNPWKG